MTSWVVADSGVYLATVFPEIISTRAEALIDSWTQRAARVAAPYLLHYEFVSVIRKHVARGNITLEEGRAALHGLLRRPIRLYTNRALLEPAFAIANAHRLPSAYDAQYLALARHVDCVFWTGDLRLYNAVGSTLDWVKWIGDFPLPEPPMSESEA
jgi:predicted nucleic acid-binding protein